LQHHRYVRVLGRNAQDQLHLVLRHGEGFAIKPFGFVAIRQPRIDQHRVFSAGKVARFAHERFVRRIVRFAIALGIRRRNSALNQLIKRAFDVERLHFAAARALIARRFCKRAEYGDARSRGKRQQRTVVFQQHSGVCCGFARERVMRCRVK